MATAQRAPTIRNRALLLGVATLLAVLASADPARAIGSLSAQASCSNGTTVTFGWTYYDSPPLTQHPEWVGYDVLRRPLPGCDPFVRVNAVPYPRILGATHSHQYTETPPSILTQYEYRLVLVDAARQPVILDILDCDPCVRSGWTSCPPFSAPLTQGTLLDFGWTLFLVPCASSCYQSLYLENMVNELRPLAGTGAIVRLYGTALCGTIEGCGMFVDHYDVAPCPGVTPALSTSWGRLKLIYR